MVISCVLKNQFFWKFGAFHMIFLAGPFSHEDSFDPCGAMASPKILDHFLFFDGPNSSTVNFIADFPCFSTNHKTLYIGWKRLICAFRCHPMRLCCGMLRWWYSSPKIGKIAEKTPKSPLLRNPAVQGLKNNPVKNLAMFIHFEKPSSWCFLWSTTSMWPCWTKSSLYVV